MPGLSGVRAPDEKINSGGFLVEYEIWSQNDNVWPLGHLSRSSKHQCFWLPKSRAVAEPEKKHHVASGKTMFDFRSKSLDSQVLNQIPIRIFFFIIEVQLQS